MKTTVYKLKSEKITKNLRIALVADLHDRPCRTTVELLRESKPDLIAVTGDLTGRLDCAEGEKPPFDKTKSATHKNAVELLTAASEIAPTFYSLGNHELCGHKYKQNFGRSCLDENLKLIADSGAQLLDDRFVKHDGLVIGGLTSGHTNPDLRPKLAWLSGFAACDGYKILLCHHPEYYAEYLRNYPIDLTLSGHAHGGQIRLFGRGLFAPSQGWFPKYTSGVYDNGRLVVSRGLCNTVRPIPRLFNPTELVIIEIMTKNV